MQRFLGEARAAGLKHPNIVPVHGVGSQEGRHFYSMDLINGLSLVFWRSRRQGLLPSTTAERQLWSVWVGYIVGCTLMALTSRHMFEWEKLYEGIDYPFFAIAADLAFFVLGSSYWGRCCAFAVAFYASAWVMVWDLRWAVLEFGGLWSLVLVILGRHLGHLGQERAEAGVPE